MFSGGSCSVLFQLQIWAFLPELSFQALEAAVAAHQRLCPWGASGEVEVQASCRVRAVVSAQRGVQLFLFGETLGFRAPAAAFMRRALRTRCRVAWCFFEFPRGAQHLGLA